MDRQPILIGADLGLVPFFPWDRQFVLVLFAQICGFLNIHVKSTITVTLILQLHIDAMTPQLISIDVDGVGQSFNNLYFALLVIDIDWLAVLGFGDLDGVSDGPVETLA